MSLDAISQIGSFAASPALIGAATVRPTGTANGRPSPEDVKRAASQFEAILVRQLLAPAIEPMMNSSLGGAHGAGGGVYGYMLTDVLASSISQGGGLGLARMLETQLSPRADSASAPSAHE